MGWLGIILVKGFSFVGPIIAANSLPWVWQGCLRSNLSAGKLACVTGLSILLPLPHDCLLPLNHKQDFPGGSDGKASVYNAGDPGLIPGLGRSYGEGNGNPLQYYSLENPMDRGAW